MIVVTGAAGFIGSCLVARLNELGKDDLILVDHFDDDHDPKHANLENKKYIRYYDKVDFIKAIEADSIVDEIDFIFHMGACSSTTLDDADYYEKNNFEYSCSVAKWSLSKNARLIYASSAATYGDGNLGYSDNLDLLNQWQPLNLYGQSKQKFDEWVVAQDLLDKMVGLKFFNVFGPNEYHKADMRSVVAKSFDKVVEEGRMSLFKSDRPDYNDGEQKRDFIYVKDVVDVMLFFMNHPDKNGIFNVGTGQARTWNDLANSLFKAVDKPAHIDYIDMPEVLKNKYQYFTQAEVENLRNVGYSTEFTSLEDAVKDYVHYLKDHSYW